MITRALIMNVLLSASLIVTGTLWVFWREVTYIEYIFEQVKFWQAKGRCAGVVGSAVLLGFQTCATGGKKYWVVSEQL